MKKTKIYLMSLIVLVYLSLLSCTKIYYIGEAEHDLTIYSAPNYSSEVIYKIPKGSRVLTKKRPGKYYYVIFKNYKGYVYSPSFSNYHRFNSSSDGALYGYSSSKASTSTSGGRVNVKGYYRKNGTYVKPHTRSAPTRKY